MNSNNNNNMELHIFGRKYENIDYILSSIIYISYHKNFPPLNQSNYTSDVGWGCTLRSLQMMIANNLIKIYNRVLPLEVKQKDLYKILFIFGDSYNNPLSIHNLSKVYKKCGHKDGEWMGPILACNLINDYKKFLKNIFNINYTHFDNLIIKFHNLDNSKPNIVILSMRLGKTNIESQYINFIKEITKYKLFSGILAGSKGKSFYIIGCNNTDQLIYLDPHHITEYTPNLHHSHYISSQFQTIEIKDISPTISISFFLKRKKIKNLQEKLIYFDNKYNLNLIFEYEKQKKTVIKELEVVDRSDDWDILG